MAKKVIISVGFQFPANEVETLHINSGRSLLDADIIVFQPGIDISNYSTSGSKNFQGKPILSTDGSFRAVETANHWRSELLTAYDAGKTVFIFLSKQEDVYRYTGEKTHSGTGTNRVTTNMVVPFNSYSSIPVNFTEVVPRQGKSIKPKSDLKYLASYWKEFSQLSQYEVYIDGQFTEVYLVTKTGDKIVGAMVQGKNKGTIFLLPQLNFEIYEHLEYDEEEDVDYWDDYAITLGQNLISIFVGIDKAVRSDRNMTPTPEWATQEKFRMAREASIEAEILRINAVIESKEHDKSMLMTDLIIEASSRRLLFEKGKELEEAIIDALNLFGFEAEPFNDAESEFDAVFISTEGRFLGEAEGKDNNAVNIKKLSQLERNIQEDFAKETIDDYAKGVLFGNAYRLVPPDERGEFFTRKCLTGAKRSSIALVRTPDLFDSVQYLKKHEDEDYKTACRKAICEAAGEIVVFPEIPLEETSSEIEIKQQ